MPKNADEALQDIDYTIHFAQSKIPRFGAQGVKATVEDRPKTGEYYYASQWNHQASKFTNYGDFETILNGAPSMKVSLIPQGVYMSGSITVTGLYNATLTYNNLFGVVGGYSKHGGVTVEYKHPTQGTLKKNYSFEEAKKLMKTVASNASEKKTAPSASEWDESSTSYSR